MKNFQDPTTHATLRMSQRGIAEDAIEWIKWIGTEVEGGYLVREKDFQSLDRDVKRLRDHVRRLVGKRLVVKGNRLVTAYHATPSKERRLLRGAPGSIVDRVTLGGPAYHRR
jgi:hypothetical protein